MSIFKSALNPWHIDSRSHKIVGKHQNSKPTVKLNLIFAAALESSELWEKVVYFSSASSKQCNVPFRRPTIFCRHRYPIFEYCWKHSRSNFSLYTFLKSFRNFNYCLCNEATCGHSRPCLEFSLSSFTTKKLRHWWGSWKFYISYSPFEFQTVLKISFLRKEKLQQM